VIRRKVLRAVTDTGPTHPGQPKSQGVENLFQLMRVLSEPSTYEHFENAYQNCTIRYGEVKKQLAEDIVRFTTPFREKIEALKDDKPYLGKVARMGAEKARVSALKTIREVREIIGFANQ
jgi:tryptophanyl-tRNA synthetase